MTPKKAEQIVAEAQRQVGKCALGQHVHRPEPYPEIQGYEIVGEIHRGGQGIVFEAQQETPSRCVAIKLLRHGLASSHEDRFRFEREMQSLGRLRHPNIVAIHDAGEVSGCRYFVMDFISGEPLDAYIHHAGLSVEQTVRFFLMICNAIEEAHKRGVFHRDLKPSNIRVDDEGNPHILDFGLAADTNAADTSITLTGQFIGSLSWASPEQAAGESNSTDARTDVYALGLILYHILTERFPYAVAGPLPVVLNTIQNTEPTRPTAFRHDIPLDLEHIVLKCLRKEKELRYQGVRELSGDLRCFLAHEPVEARSASNWYKLKKTVRRHPKATATLALVVLVTAGYATTATVLYRRALHAEMQASKAAEEAKESASELETVYEDLLDRIARMERTPGTVAFRRDLVAGAYDGLTKLVKKKPDSRPLSESFAATLFRLGNFAVELGHRNEALGYFREAAQIREALVREQPERLEIQADLSVNSVRIGDTLRQLGHVDGVRELYERALAIDEALVEAEPENAHFWDNLSWSYDRLGFLARNRGENDLATFYSQKQLEAATRAVQLEPDNPVRRGTLIQAQLRTASEFDASEESIALTDAKLRLQAARLRETCNPPIAGAEAARIRAEEVVKKARANGYSRAKAIETRAIESRRKLERAPDNPELVRMLLDNLWKYAYAAREGGLDMEAKQAIDAAIPLATKLAQVDPEVVDNLRLLARLHASACTWADEDGDFETAFFHNQEELKANTAALQLAPSHPELLLDAWAAQQEEGLLLLRLNRQREADAVVSAAMAAAEEARVAGLMSPDFERAYGRTLTEPQALGFRDIQRGLDMMIEAVERLCPDDPLCWEGIGNAAAAAGRMDIACPTYQRALEIDPRLAP